MSMFVSCIFNLGVLKKHTILYYGSFFTMERGILLLKPGLYYINKKRKSPKQRCITAQKRSPLKINSTCQNTF